MDADQNDGSQTGEIDVEFKQKIEEKTKIRDRNCMGLTEAVFDEVIKGVAIAIVGELVVGGRKLLEALRGDAGEISGELCVLGQNHSASSHEAVDQRLLPHLETLILPPNAKNNFWVACLYVPTYGDSEV